MPRDTSVILSEETASTGTGVSFFRCPLSEVGKQSQRLARVCPKWVSDCVLKVCLSNSSLIAMPRETIYFSNPGFVLPERCHQDELCAQLGEREEDSNPASWVRLDHNVSLSCFTLSHSHSPFPLSYFTVDEDSAPSESCG